MSGGGAKGSAKGRTQTKGIGAGAGSSARERRDGIPLYLKLASVLREKIARGDWQTGQQLPTLPELQSEYGLARSTIRQALGVLRGESLIDSARGRGTFVTGEPRQPASAKAPSYDPLHLGAGFRIEILAREPCTTLPEIGIEISGMPGPYMHVRKRHHFGGEPYSFVNLWLPHAVYDMLPAGADETQVYSQLLRDHTGIRNLEGAQKITVVRADYNSATALELEFSSPLARIASCVTSEGGEPILAHSTLIRADLFVAERRFGDFTTNDPATWRATLPSGVATGSPSDPGSDRAGSGQKDIPEVGANPSDGENSAPAGLRDRNQGGKPAD